MPDGRNVRSVISPTGSGSAAICSSPSAIAAIVFGVERQPVDERGVVAGRLRRRDVLGVGGEQRRLVAADRGRHRRERGVLGRGVGARELARRGARGVADVAHVGSDVGDVRRPRALWLVMAGIVARRRRRAGRSAPESQRAHAVVAAEQDDVGAALREQADGDDAGERADLRLQRDRDRGS